MRFGGNDVDVMLETMKVLVHCGVPGRKTLVVGLHAVLGGGAEVELHVVEQRMLWPGRPKNCTMSLPFSRTPLGTPADGKCGFS